ncbi:hypothetical protein RB195_005789 [Necator americanus]|uniref:Uncharacterized protein n=1 Tax=Necator americanus TaxID=51031 RepID=A0ABR1BTE0_NECAM
MIPFKKDVNMISMDFIAHTEIPVEHHERVLAAAPVIAAAPAIQYEVHDHHYHSPSRSLQSCVLLPQRNGSHVRFGHTTPFQSSKTGSCSYAQESSQEEGCSQKKNLHKKRN